MTLSLGKRRHCWLLAGSLMLVACGTESVPQANVLSPAEVTPEAYAAAVDETIECLEDLGLEVATFDGGIEPMVVLEFPVTDVEDVDEQADACLIEILEPVEEAFFDRLTQPEGG